MMEIWLTSESPMEISSFIPARVPSITSTMGTRSVAKVLRRLRSSLGTTLFVSDLRTTCAMSRSRHLVSVGNRRSTNTLRIISSSKSCSLTVAITRSNVFSVRLAERRFLLTMLATASRSLDPLETRSSASCANLKVVEKSGSSVTILPQTV